MSCIDQKAPCASAAELGVRVDVGQRQMAEDVAQAAGRLHAEHLADGWLRLPAERTLEVRVLHQGDDPVGVTPDVVAVRIHVVGEVDDLFGGPAQLLEPPRRRDQGPRASEQGDRDRGRDQTGGEDAELRLFELRSGEGEAGDQEGDGEPDTRCGPGPEEPGVGDREPSAPEEPADRSPRRKPGEKKDAERLADDVTEDDPDRDVGGDRLREEAGRQVDARVRKREQRHDYVARPRMERVLEALVR
jgi:hypothetical protein